MRKTVLATLLAGSVLSLNAHAIDLLQVYREALANDAVYASARSTLAASG
jgi:outer membrane protein